MKIEIWSDFVCPFCYIGKRRLELALEQFPHKDQVQIEYKSFELDPHAPTHSEQGIYEALAAKYGSTVEQMKQMNKGLIQQAAELGLSFEFEGMKPTNTFDAHRLSKYAKTIGKDKEITEKLLSAYFTKSKNVGDIDTLVEVALEAGIEREKALEVLSNKTSYEEEVRNDQSLAKQYGIQGVPFFLLNQKYAISGAQSPETFAGALQKVWNEEHQKPMFQDLTVSDPDVCTDDGCIVPQNTEK
ncbi:DsbA family oxidoreductase [Metabacillus halosaccharovorans]|uniref:DsbA family oxidoreductase n=1 Tax=Metabacillus halosaccharovorans TaxID=930124 RepID=UPI00203DB4EC|nr:DsbA family oxidoreductase [Metabacillus halosaccharovorans]MCM3442251.1 DsbA family oxidoreductase [Metabacillus halosaccharovorans]